jgi:hypothetical protein
VIPSTLVSSRFRCRGSIIGQRRLLEVSYN